jgi:hypothetical protein
MKILFFLGLLFFLLSCSEGVIRSEYIPPSDWKYSDLRIFDPAGFSEAGRDIIGFYYRDLGEAAELRIDFFDLDPDIPTGLLVAFHHGYAGSHQLPFGLRPSYEWNQLMVLLPDGRIFLLNEKFQNLIDPKVSVVRDTTLDALIIKIEKTALINLSPKTSVKLFTFGDDFSYFDELGPVLLNGFPPEPIKVIIAFWNTFRAETPAQALRTWDGAHTGPSSTRHGLKALLDAVEITGIPVFLLDLRSKQNFSVLEYMGALTRVRSLEAKGLVILPKQDNFIFSSLDFDVTNIELEQSILEGLPSFDTRKILIKTLQSPGTVLILGGDFSKSAWGNYLTSVQLLNFIKNHPWLKPLNDESILKFQVIEEPIEADYRISDIMVKIKSLPDNPIKQILQNLISSYTKMEDGKERELQYQYLSQLGHLLAILEWSKNPQAITDCERDFDWDHKPECLLATENTVAIIETQGGYISFAFVHNSGEFHQIIGPSFQLMTGISDPIEWDLSQGIGADPKVIPGAFANSKQKWAEYTPTQISPGSITLVEKTFFALQDGYLFDYLGSEADQLLIPIILDPWVMEYHNWGELNENKFGLRIWRWGLKNKLIITLQSSDPMEILTFKDSYKLISFPEEPSFAYPEGHFLPFPLALAKIQIDGDVSIRLKITHSYSN